MTTTQQQEQPHPRLTYRATRLSGKSYIVQYDGTEWRNVAVAQDATLGSRIALLLSVFADITDAELAAHAAQHYST